MLDSVNPGPHWEPASADEPETSLDDATIEGTQLRLMCDYGGGIPLWDAAGGLPDDPAFLQRTLSLSPELVADLIAWSVAWDPTATHDPTYTQGTPSHAARGRELLGRVREEITPGYSVVLKL